MMTFKPHYFIFRHKSLVALSVVLWLRSGIVHGAKIPPNSISTTLQDISVTPSSQDSQVLKSESDNIILLSARYFSPDVLATAVPVPPLSYKTGASPHPENRDLHLRSSSWNVSGIAGYSIYALPILVSELASLLSDTRSDLQKHDANAGTPFYQFNTTKWTFSVITANASLHYIYIQNVVSHFLKLTTTSFSPNDITTTRVGVVLNGSIPIADVTIMPMPNPMNSAYNPFSSFGMRGNTPSTQPAEIAIITPIGSTCSFQSVNESALLTPFSTLGDLGSTEQPRSLEAEVFAHVGQTVFELSMRLWRRPDGLPVQVKVWAATTVVTIAYLQLSVAALKRLFLVDYMRDPAMDEFLDKRYKLDTGFFVLGRMGARLVMEITKRDPQGKLLALTLETWQRFLKVLLAPLQEMGAFDNAWALEGKIYGPENGDVSDGTNSSQVLIGRWELFFVDNELG